MNAFAFSVMLNEVKHLREAIWLKGDGTRA
jgi:hypothetical protein